MIHLEAKRTRDLSIAKWLILLLLAAMTAVASTTVSRSATDPVTAYIVQGADIDAVAAAVRAVGAKVTHELGIINAVGAELTDQQAAELESQPIVTRLLEDR